MKTISLDQLKKRLDANALVINVLPNEYFRDKHIPGSINVPHEQEEFAAKVQEIAGGKDVEIILYCASYECDAGDKAGEKLEQAGFTDVYDYEGGIKEWFEREDVNSLETI